MYIGDFALGKTFDLKFTTRATTGVPTQLAGTPSVAAYPDNSTTEITAGITLTVDFDSRTGLNNVRVVATSGNGYATATNYALVITAGTVSGNSVVGEVIGHFSIEARSALRPTTADRTLVVDANGLADANTVKVGPTGNGTAQTAGDIIGDTNDIQNRLPAALTGGRIDASVGAYQTGLTPLQPTTAGRTLDVTATGEAGIDWANIGGATTTVNLSGTTIKAVTDGVTLAAAAIQAIWDALTSALTTVGSIGKLLVDNINATISSRLASASITLTGGKVTVGTNDDKTGYSIGAGGIASAAFAANAIDSAAVDASVGQEVADEILNRDLAMGSSGSSRNVQNALRANRNRVVIAAGGSTTVYEEDDVTPAWTATATRDASADNITEINPA